MNKDSKTGRFLKGFTPWNKGLKTGKKVNLECHNCKNTFDLSESLYRDRIKRKTKIFCGRKCKDDFFKVDFRQRMNNLPLNVKKEMWRKIGLKSKGRHLSNEAKLRISKKNKGIGNGMYGKTHSLKAREIIRRTSTERWQNKEYKEKVIKAVLKSILKKPTGLEQQMIDIINKNHLPYKYVGDGDFIIGGWNPDFVNVNGEKKLIEVGNNYERHHPKDYGKIRSEHFAKYGWKSYIILTNKKLEEKEVLALLK